MNAGHWARLRTAVQLNPSKSEVATSQLDDKVSFLPMEAIGEDGSLQLDRTRKLSEVLSGYTYFREDDVLIAKITPCFENGKGAVAKGLTNGFGFGTTELIVARARKGRAIPQYLFWLFQSPEFRGWGEGAMYGAGGQKRVPDEFVLDYRAWLPPLPEQTAIAAFLDRETGKIDALVEEQKRLIALLKEKRQAVISHAVTKGLDLNVPMKPSGVEWLGDVPEHWEVQRLKRLGSIRYGIGEPPQYVQEGVPLIRATNVRTGNISRVGMVYVNPDDIPSNRIVWLQPGDIIVVRSGANTGDSALVSSSYEGAIAGFDMVLRPTFVNPSFLQLALLSSYVKAGQIVVLRTRAAQPHLNAEELGGCQIVVPPPSEQQAIADYVTRILVRYNSLAEQAEATIALLQERRAALISAAVTGKIDVRAADNAEEMVA